MKMSTAILHTTETDAECRALYQLVRDFARAMADKLIVKQIDGQRGWDSEQMYPVEGMQARFMAAVEKGDPVDIANWAAFLWNRDARIDPAAIPLHNPPKDEWWWEPVQELHCAIIGHDGDLIRLGEDDKAYDSIVVGHKLHNSECASEVLRVRTRHGYERDMELAQFFIDAMGPACARRPAWLAGASFGIEERVYNDGGFGNLHIYGHIRKEIHLLCIVFMEADRLSHWVLGRKLLDALRKSS